MQIYHKPLLYMIFQYNSARFRDLIDVYVEAIKKGIKTPLLALLYESLDHFTTLVHK